MNRVSVRDADKRDHKTNTFPTTTKAGQVRIQRIGTVLHYLVADDSGTTFRELAEEEFVSDECTVRLVANTGSGPAVDARLVDLRIRADHLPITATGSARPWVWTRRLLLALLGVAVVGAGIAGFRWWHRRRAAAA